MNDFNEFIDRMEFLDMPMLGRNFTWCNSFDGDRWSRLDRFLVNPIWLEKFRLKLWGLPRSMSDHCPLLLMEDDRNWGPRPFRFLNAWTLHPKFLELVRRSWSQNEIEGWAGYRFRRKLYALKEDLKLWNTEIFGNVDNQLKMAEEELHELDLKAEAGPLVESEIQRRRVVRDQMWKLSRRKQWMWQQKSRVKWTQEGDKNTMYFHVMANKRQSQNLLDSIIVNGSCLMEPDMVRQGVFEHFKGVYSENWSNRPKLLGQFKSVANRDEMRILKQLLQRSKFGLL